jgi:hypothetical protein
MAIAKRDEMRRSITESCGKPRDSLVLAGVTAGAGAWQFTHDASQQRALLGIHKLRGRKKISLPKRSTEIKNDVIFDVTVCHHEEEIATRSPCRIRYHPRQ